MLRPAWLSDTYDRRALLYHAGMLLLGREKYKSASGVFGKLASMEPHCSLVWYCLASALYNLAGTRRDLSVLRVALSCAKRSQEEDPSNRYACDLRELIETQTPLSVHATSDVGPYRDPVETILEKAGFDDVCLAKEASSLSKRRERMQLVIFLGHLDDSFATELLINSLDDQDADVRMAALKRIGSWGDREDLKAKLERLASASEREKVGPYIFMALGRIAESGGKYAGWARQQLLTLKKETGFDI
jgi:hypothetical protein